NMVAEVCSVYVLRVDGTLELYATEGLNKAAVHQTVLRSDEGLVGLVASEANPVNLSEAQNHPAFSYRIETGEEIYHSFLGVPVLRAGNTLGVLVVQNRARRTYTEEEEEALPTTAAGCTAWKKRWPPASPPRRRSNACSRIRARACCAPPTRICASACTTSTSSPTASCTSCSARTTRRRATDCRKTPCWSPAP